MKKFLPGLLIVLFSVTALALPFRVGAAAAPAPQQQQLRTPPPEGLWVADPEVTFIGKNAARSGNLLDWTLRNYNWVCVKQAGTNAINQYQCDDSQNPLARFWLLIVSFIVVPLLFVVILATAIVIIITRGKSLTIMRFIPRFVAVIILIVFSYSLLQFLYQFTDVIQGFFLRSDPNLQTVCPPNCISQKDLLYVGWHYEDFVGLRLLHDYYAESAFMSLLLTKLTALTYFVMVGILLMRKIILWFFIVVSPIFPLLLLYYPVRNTGKIWIGEFFRWLLYAPLFAMFLNGLVYMWRQQIPLLFIPPQGITAIGDKSQIVYPTAVNILLGGPKQYVTPDNSVNLTETFALYVVALIMLWVVILLPWILLQIFLDYASNFSPGESAVMKTLVSLAGNKKPAPGGGGGGIGPAPSGAAILLPFTKKFQMPTGLSPTSGGSAKEIPTSTGSSFAQTTFAPTAQVNAQVLNIASVQLPTMRDIARYDSAQYSNDTSRMREVSLAKETLERIANPVAVTNTVEREKFSDIRDKLTQESQQGNLLATSILNAASSVSSAKSNSSSNVSTSQMQSILQQIANPVAAAAQSTNVVNREKMTQLHDMLSHESKENNSQLASSLLSVSEKTSASEIEKIRDSLVQASNQSSSVASSVLAQLSTSRQSAENTKEVRSVMQSIANPASVGNPIDRSKFSKLHDALEKESKENNNTLATSILQVSDKTTSDQIEKLKESLYQSKESTVASTVLSSINNAVSKQQQTTQVKSVLQQVANPASATSPINREKLTKLQESLSKASKEGNDLATSILKVSDKTSAADIEKIQEKIQMAKQRGEPLGTQLAGMTQMKAAAPVVNRVQTVSKEDYDEVRNLWKENYSKLEVPQGMAGTRAEWIKDDVSKIDKIVASLSSTDKEKVQEGMDEVANILPFLLMGGFSQTEIVAYLKAKQDAGKDVVASIAAEEETKVSVGTQTAQAEKTMAASFDTSSSVTSESESPLTNITASTTNIVTPQISNDIFAMVDLKLPKMRDVVRYETRSITKDTSKMADIQKTHSMLEKISNPEAAAAGPERMRFVELREKLLTASSQGNATAAVILSAAASATKTQAPSGSNVKSVLQQIAAPTSEENKKRYEGLHKKLEDASKGGNELASSILAVRDTTSVDEIEKLRTKLTEAKQKGEPIASDILAHVPESTSLPSANSMQHVSKEEFDEVKTLWKENYTNLEVPQGMAGTRAEWIKDDITKIDTTVGLLTSANTEDVKKGVEEVSNILPFLLMGGYSQSEIVSYLKAKQEAAKDVLQTVSAEEETKVSVGTQTAQAEKTMAVTASVDTGSNEAREISSPATHDILSMAKLQRPKMKDIAHLDAGFMKHDKEKAEEAAQMSTILKKIANPEPLATEAEREEYKKLKEKLNEESGKGNTTATAILSAAASTSTASVELNVLPLTNADKAVGPEEFEEVKSVWSANYQSLPIPPEFGAEIKGRLEWIRRDMTEVQSIIDLLVSSDPEKKKEGINKATSILPFMLLGGFSLPEMIAYLKAKYDAAKETVAKLEEEESNKVSVDATPVAGEQPKEAAQTEEKKEE